MRGAWPCGSIPAWRVLALLLALPCVLLPARAGLLADHTRIIYPQGSTARSVRIANTNPWPVLVQTWIDRGEGDLERAAGAFVVVPTVFRLEPDATRTLTILSTGERLPDDRESLFWLNLYEIPPTPPAADADTAQLTLTLTTQIKLFHRPAGIGAPADLAARLQLGLNQDTTCRYVLARNPTPWHATLGALAVDGTDGLLPADTPDLLLPPASTRRWCLRAGQPADAAQIHFSLIDDGGFSQPHHAPLQRVLP